MHCAEQCFKYTSILFGHKDTHEPSNSRSPKGATVMCCLALLLVLLVLVLLVVVPTSSTGVLCKIVDGQLHVFH
jgi:hypothetical protein